MRGTRPQMTPMTSAATIVTDDIRPSLAGLPPWKPPDWCVPRGRPRLTQVPERRSPRVERRPRRRHLVADVEIDADIAGRPLREALGEALAAVRARAGAAVVASDPGGDPGLQAGHRVVGHERVVDHVAELVQDDAVDPAPAVERGDPAEVDRHRVARAAALGQSERGR